MTDSTAHETTTHEEMQRQQHQSECATCAAHVTGAINACETGVVLAGRAREAGNRQRAIETMQRLQMRKARDEYLDFRDFRDLKRLERIYGASASGYCPSWRRDQGCPLHGELCSPERDPMLRRQVLTD